MGIWTRICPINGIAHSIAPRIVRAAAVINQCIVCGGSGGGGGTIHGNGLGVLCHYYLDTTIALDWLIYFAMLWIFRSSFIFLLLNHIYAK